jgi:hypothetical protein
MRWVTLEDVANNGKLAATVFDLFYNALRIRAERAASKATLPT